MGLSAASAADAYPPDKVPYCSDGFDKPARIVLSESQQMYLKEGDNPEIHWTAQMTVTLTVGKATHDDVPDHRHTSMPRSDAR